MKIVGRVFYWTACRIDTGRQIVSRPGRKGAFLIMFGAIYVMLGYSYTGMRPTHDLRQSLKIAINLAPLWAYGIVWMLAGAVIIVCGIDSRRRLGWLLASGVPAVWSLIYLVAWLSGDTTRGPVSFIVYAAFAVAVNIVAGLIDPRRLAEQADLRRCE